MKKNDEKVICIYDENGPSINEKILEVFKKYLDKELNKPITYTQVGNL